MTELNARYRIVHFDDLPGTPCPCGTARRAFTDEEASPGTIHRTQITADAKVHYHRRLTETYYILKCEEGAAMELDGERIAVREGTCILIPPGIRHRAVGPMTVLIVVVPKFDPEDEVVVEEDPT